MHHLGNLALFRYGAPPPRRSEVNFKHTQNSSYLKFNTSILNITRIKQIISAILLWTSGRAKTL